MFDERHNNITMYKYYNLLIQSDGIYFLIHKNWILLAY